MTHKVMRPIALDRSFNTTESTPRNIADVLAQNLQGIKEAIAAGGGSSEVDAAFVCYWGRTTAQQIYNAIENGKIPYFYDNGVVAQLWKVATNKYTFRTTAVRTVGGKNYLDITDYIVDGAEWTSEIETISGGESGHSAYIERTSSQQNLDTNGLTGPQDLVSVTVPSDGIYHISMLISVTPKSASPARRDLVFQFTGGSGVGLPGTTFYSAVDNSQPFVQQFSYSTALELKAGVNTLRLLCGGFSSQYLVFVEDFTIAQLVNGVYHNGDDFDELHTFPEALGFNEDDGVLVDGQTAGPRYMKNQTLLRLASQKALANNVAQEFDPSKPNDAGGYAYYKDEIVAFEGATYKFAVNHSSGPWNSSEVYRYNAGECLRFFIVTDNPDYLYAVTDKNGAFILGIKPDGSVDWQKGIPDHIRIPLELATTTLPTKVDKEDGKTLINSVFSSEISVISSPEYLLAIVDTADRILFSINRSGKVDFQKGVPDSIAPYIEQLKNKVDSEEGKSLIDSSFAEAIKTPEHTEYVYSILDKDGRFLFGIDKNGNVTGKFSVPEGVHYFDSVEDMKKYDRSDIAYARTLGFYAPGDGGAATYKVVVGVEDGFSKFRMNNGKIAQLVIEQNYLYPEQVGYTNADRSKDLRTYLFYITRDLLIDSVHLYNRRYYQNGPWIVPRQGISIIGSSNSGDQQSDGNYYYTRILYSSTRTDNGACVFDCEYREFRLENVELRNLDAEDPSKPPRIGIYTLDFHLDPEDPRYNHYDHYDMIIKNVRIGNFEYGLNLNGNIKWNLQIDNVRCSACTYGCRIYGHALVATFKLFYPDHCQYGVLIDTLTVAVSFLYCNFGTINKCIVFDKGYEGNPYGQYTFIGCNFELDEIPSEPKEGLFLEVSEIYRAMITMIGCNFNMSKIEDSAYTSSIFGFKLNDRTELTMIGCQQSDMRWDRQLLNPSYPARKKLGSVKVIHSEGIDRPNYTDEYLPTVDIDGTIHTRSLAALNDYYSDAAPGTIVYDETEDKTYIKLTSTYKEI